MTDTLNRPIDFDDPHGAGLAVNWLIDGQHVVIALSGEIDLANVDALPDAIAGAIGRDSSVRIDIADVTFLDSSLLRLLLICEASCARRGVELKVRNPTDQARRIFELTRLTSLLESRSRSGLSGCPSPVG